MIGATGNVGQEVVKCLLEQNQDVVAATSNENHAKKVLGENTPTVLFDFGDQGTYAESFENVEKVFLIRPPQISDVKQYIEPVIDHMAKAGVKQIVFLSLIGVEKNTIVPHHKIEKYIESSGISYTFLRPSFFMQNLNTTHRLEIKEENEIFVPVGKAKTNFIDVRDIGAVAAKVLIEDGYQNQAFEITGSEALTYEEVATLFTEILGRKIAYTNPSLVKFFLSNREKGIPLPFIVVMAGLYTSTRFGMAKKSTQTVKELLGRDPISMKEYISDYKDTWE